MKIAFLVDEVTTISGGTNVVVEHAAGLAARGHEVAIATVFERPGQPWHPRLKDLRVAPLKQVARERFDFAFATFWSTFYELWRLQATVYGYLNQSLESRFHAERHRKLLSRATYSLPLLFVTEATWLAELIQAVQPEGKVVLVRNGLSSESFPCVDRVPERSGPLRVLVEGPWTLPYKGVPETFALLSEARAQVEFTTGWLTRDSAGARPTVGGTPVRIHEQIPIDQVRSVMQEHDVLVKLSRVEGMFGPPLEMFSQGGTAITTNVTGSEEYMVHGLNGLIVEPYNLRQLGRYLKLLGSSSALLTRLRRNALDTARNHPSWAASAGELETRLLELQRDAYTNAHLRPALTALSALYSHWTDDAWRQEHAIGPGEQALLGRYRRIKQAPAVQAAMRLVPEDARAKLRSFLARVLK